MRDAFLIPLVVGLMLLLYGLVIVGVVCFTDDHRKGDG